LAAEGEKLAIRTHFFTLAAFRRNWKIFGAKSQGCQIFLGTTYQKRELINAKWQPNIPNGRKIYQISIKIPNGHKIHRSFPIKVLSKCNKIWIFGMQIYHLATLTKSRSKACVEFLHDLDWDTFALVAG
jgi:hypothetical protein